MRDLVKKTLECNAFFQDEDFDQARSCYKEILLKSRAWKQKFTPALMIGTCYLKEALQNIEAGQFKMATEQQELAMFYFKMCEDMARENEDDEKMISVLERKMTCLLSFGKRKEAKKLEEEIEDLKQKPHRLF